MSFPTEGINDLIAACELAFAGPEMADEPDAEDISVPPCGITFGMIRQARLELSVLEEFNV